MIKLATKLNQMLYVTDYRNGASVSLSALGQRLAFSGREYVERFELFGLRA